MIPPFISIIIPVHNVERYIRGCLNSLIAQTYTDFEVIAVDDGSPDKSGEICDEYSSRDSRIKVIHQPNSGPGPARNTGIDAAKGEYIMFVDADDFAAPNMLEVALTTIRRNNCDLVMFGNYAITYNRDETKIKKTEEWLPANRQFSTAEQCRQSFCDILFSTSFQTPWNKIYRTDIIREHSIKFPSLRRAQDAIFNMEYYRYISSFTIISSPLYYFRQNTSAKVWRKFPKDLYKVDIYYDKFLVEMLMDWGVYDGANKERVDRLMVNSAFKTIGFCRNPYWHLDRKAREEYILTILNGEYLTDRLRNAKFSDNITESKRLLLLSKDCNAIMRRIRSDERRNKFYDSSLYRFLSATKHKLGL